MMKRIKLSIELSICDFHMCIITLYMVDKEIMFDSEKSTIWSIVHCIKGLELMDL